MSVSDVLLLFLVITYAVGYDLPPDPSRFNEYKQSDMQTYFNEFVNYYKHKFNYKDKERHYRIFEENVKMINTMNNEDPTHVKYRINEFTHLTLKQFTDLYTGFNDTGLDHVDVKDFVYQEAGNPDPVYLTTNIAWVSPIPKHQGSGCKNSYVFSAVGNIEAQIQRSFSKYKELSEQQGFDCEEAGSCRNGGLPHLVMEALIGQGGLYNSEDYEYKNPTANYTKFCKWVKKQTDFKVTGVNRMNVKNETGLMGAVYLFGPVVTSIYVSDSVKNYHSGVLDPSDCDRKPNHAVLVVGYGMAEEKIPFWEIKNSWGINWGQMGYMRLVRGKRACRIGAYVATATVGTDKAISASTMRPIQIAPEEMVTMADFLKGTQTQPKKLFVESSFSDEEATKAMDSFALRTYNYSSGKIAPKDIIRASDTLKHGKVTNASFSFVHLSTEARTSVTTESLKPITTKTAKGKRVIDSSEMEARMAGNVFLDRDFRRQEDRGILTNRRRQGDTGYRRDRRRRGKFLTTQRIFTGFNLSKSDERDLLLST